MLRHKKRTHTRYRADEPGMRRYSSTPTRRDFPGWPEMGCSGVIHALLKDVRIHVRIGLRALLRYLCGYKCDEAVWTSAEAAFAGKLRQRLRWACLWRATRPLLGAMRIKFLGEKTLARAVVAQTRDTIPNESLPKQLQSFGLGVPNLARTIEAYNLKMGKPIRIHSSNYELLRQGLTPDKFRVYHFCGSKVYLTYRFKRIIIEERDLERANCPYHVDRGKFSLKWRRETVDDVSSVDTGDTQLFINYVDDAPCVHDDYTSSDDHYSDYDDF